MAVLVWTTGALALIVVAAMLFQFADRRQPVNLTTAPVTTGDVERRIMVTGTLQPARSVAVGAQVSGTIQSIDADFNDAVQAGQVVARIDPSIYEAQLVEATARLTQLRAEHDRAEAAADDAQTKLTRSEQLGAADVIPAAELDAARVSAKQAASALKAAAADIAAAQAVAAEAQVSLNYTTIRSPIEGFVIGRHVDVGQAVKASVQTPVLFTIADTRRMHLLAEIAESDVAGVRPGSKATFQIESLGIQSFEGTVSSLRLQPYLQQVARPADRGTASSESQTVTSSPMPVGSSSAQPSSVTSPTPTGTSGTVETASPPTGQSAPATAATGSSIAPPAGGVVTYFAVIDVNNAGGTVPPGGTALVFLPAQRRQNVVRVPNKALTFRPSRAAFAAVAQSPPTLDVSPHEREARRGERPASVWKFESGRFIPIAVDVGVSDELHTEIVGGSLRAGDIVVTDAVPF
jgi:HlyD family secretion protein